MSAILDFTNSAMFKVISNPTTRSGIPENPIADTKIVNVLLFCRKTYQFIVRPWANGGHLAFFTHNAMSKIFSDNTTISGIPAKPHDRHLKYESISIVSKMI